MTTAPLAVAFPPVLDSEGAVSSRDPRVHPAVGDVLRHPSSMRSVSEVRRNWIVYRNRWGQTFGCRLRDWREWAVGAVVEGR